MKFCPDKEQNGSLRESFLLRMGILTFSFGRPKEKTNKKKNRRLKTKAGFFINWPGTQTQVPQLTPITKHMKQRTDLVGARSARPNTHSPVKLVN